ncbi:hypothetical protein ACSFN6_001981 [Escherichia coli]|nr:hypothetical protein [Escherichia coli]
MACSRGRASPGSITVRKLFASSGGYCQNPKCLEPLFEDAGDKIITIGELAHIFSAIDNGPRTNTELTAEERGYFDNIILLCANCHTKIDKAENYYTDEIIRGWKGEHIAKINATFGVREFNSREEVHAELDKLFRENKVIFNTYGPQSEAALNPESPQVNIWLRKIQTHILPNNRKIIRLIDKNYQLIHEDEKDVFVKLCMHVDDFESKHLELTCDNGEKFPPEAIDLFKG